MVLKLFFFKSTVLQLTPSMINPLYDFSQRNRQESEQKTHKKHTQLLISDNESLRAKNLLQKNAKNTPKTHFSSEILMNYLKNWHDSMDFHLSP